jgi:hypothetical protein
MEAQIVAYTSIGTSILFALGALVRMNHKRIRSSCCKKELELSIDVEDTTPKKSEPLSISQPK